ncbi:ABC transporter permease [Paenibacillus sp. J2TS4]|uniref:ABC transporter permease n=1 Tax=Paenibacillus sp. J2TS4 TaxID=2807194 RepID=UPI001B27F51E|nr:ABC transporter permease [Paenibacillus sp. J2TS4]GIP35421.1 putative transport permease YfiM [Paenibacillus sp. J2TS4]
MRFFVVAQYEMKRILRNGSTYFIQLLLPLLLIFILGSALSSFINPDKPTEEVKVVVVSQDQGHLQQGLDQFLTSEGISERLKAEYAETEEEALSQLKEGEADLTVFIPAGFSSSVLAGQPAEWRMLTGQDSVRSLTAQIMMQIYLEETNRMQAAAIVLGQPEAQAVFAAAAEKVEMKYADYVSSSALGNGSTEYTAFQYYAAAMLIMFVLYAGLSAATSLVNEREANTLLRLSSMPVPVRSIIFGKIAANGLVTFIQVVLIIVLTGWLYGVHWGTRPGWLMLISLLIVIASMSLALLISNLAKDSKRTATIFNVIIIVMTFLSGGFTTAGAVVESLGKLTVSHWAFQGILRIMLDESTQSIIYYIAVLAAICAGLLAVALLTYRKAGSYE